MSSHHNKPFFIHHPAFDDVNKQLNRRDFLFKSAVGLGALATGSHKGRPYIKEMMHQSEKPALTRLLQIIRRHIV
ncbi:MAG: hypothetical protein RJA90_824 [Bacteroidota bacterium]